MLAASAAGCGGPTSVLANLRPKIDGATGVLVYVFDPRGRLGMPMKPANAPSASFALPGSVVINVDDNVGKVKLLVEAVDSGLNPLATGFTGDWVIVPAHRQTAVEISLSRTAPADCDMDRIPDAIDNCRCKYNPDQLDKNANKMGDACEGEPGDGGGGSGGTDGGGSDDGGGDGGSSSDTPAEPVKDSVGAEPIMDTPAAEPPASDMPPPSCDVVASSGCMAGQKCGLDCMSKSITCIAAGAGKVGDTCMGESSCMAGTTCACDAMMVCKCYKYCKTTADCTAPTACTANLNCMGDPAGTVRAKVCI